METIGVDTIKKWSYKNCAQNDPNRRGHQTAYICFWIDTNNSSWWKLYLNLKTTNLSDSPFVISEGYHTYFYISDIENIKVNGLEDSVYTDKADNFSRGIEENSISFSNEFDRAYTNTSNDCYIEDENFNRVITIKKSNSNSTVVWTPWQEKALEMGDMGEEDEWRRMICVETANILENSVVIYPKMSHSIATEYSVQEY